MVRPYKKKNMKKIFTTYGKLCKLPLGWSLWGFLFFLIFATACTNDVAEVNTSQQQEQYVTVRMNVPGMQTTVSRTAEDGLIETVHALAFNSEGTHLGTSEATNLENLNVNNGYNGTFSLKVPNGTTTIHFLANLPDDYDLSGVNKESDLCNLSIGDWQNLCYWGMATTFDGNTNPLNVTLYRNLARISIKPSVTAPELNQFTQEQLKMTGFYMPNERGALIPNNNGTFDFDMNSNYCTIPQDVTSANYQLWEFTSMYAFEHENTDSNPTYIICKIGDYHYKVALVDDEGNRYPIIRNHEYIIYVSDVDDYAYDTNYRAVNYSDAFNKKPINLDVEEVVLQNVTFTYTNKTLYLKDSLGNSAPTSLDVKVTIPDGTTLNSLTIAAPGFIVKNGEQQLVDGGTYTDNTERAANSSVTYTFIPKADANNYTITFSSTDDDLIVDKEISVTVKNENAPVEDIIWEQTPVVIGWNDNNGDNRFLLTDNRIMNNPSICIVVDVKANEHGQIQLQGYIPGYFSISGLTDGDTDKHIIINTTQNSAVPDGTLILEGVGVTLKKIYIPSAVE